MTMPSILGNLIVIAVLVIVVGLAVRSLWRDDKNGSGCGGICAICKGCHGACRGK